MDQSPRICPRCQQANFPIAEFCRHCGEPIFEMGSLSRRSTLSRLVGHVIDGMFWFIDELARWWEIGRLVIDLKSLRRRRADFLKRSGEGREDGGDLSPTDREKLLAYSEEISRLATREEFLRKRSWALTPELLLLVIVCTFIGGIIWLRPRTDLAISRTETPMVFQGDLTRFAEVPLSGFSVVTTAVWHGSQVFVGGDGGLAVIDPNARTVNQVAGLPPGFFVRHLFSEGGRLLIAGYGGVYALDGQTVSPLYGESVLPVSLINRVIPTTEGGHLLGTVGHGLFMGHNNLAVMVLGTQGLTLTGFAWMDGELWLLHERGLLHGQGTAFEPFALQVLQNKTLTALTVEKNTIYIGTSDGIIIGYRSDKSWVWTPLSPGEPRQVRGLSAAQGVLLIAAAEGLFRYSDGRFDRLAATPNLSALAVGRDLLAAASPNLVTLYRFSGSPLPSVSTAPTVPMVGTFVAQTAPPPQPPPANPPGTSVTDARMGPPRQDGAGLAGTNAPVPTIAPPPSAPPTGLPPQAAPPPILPPQTAPTNAFSPPVPVPSPAPSQPPPVSGPATAFGSAPLPDSLRSPFVSSLAWDGRRLWVGTANDGVWSFANGTWTGLNTRNGGLADDQVVSLWMLQGRPHLFSWFMGLMDLDSGRAVTIIPKDKVKDFLFVTADAGNIMLLFQGGFIRRLTQGGNLEPVSRIPEDFFKSARHLHLVEGKPVVVADQGVLAQDPTGRWLVSFFPTQGREGKATASLVGSDGRIYVALSTGEVFAAAGRNVTRLGSIDQKPRTMAYTDTLWIAGPNQLYRLAGGTLTPAGPRSRETISDFETLNDKQLVVLATNFGLLSIPLP